MNNLINMVVVKFDLFLYFCLMVYVTSPRTDYSSLMNRTEHSLIKF